MIRIHLVHHFGEVFNVVPYSGHVVAVFHFVAQRPHQQRRMVFVAFHRPPRVRELFLEGVGVVVVKAIVLVPQPDSQRDGYAELLGLVEQLLRVVADT